LWFRRSRRGRREKQGIRPYICSWSTKRFTNTFYVGVFVHECVDAQNSIT
jgi:hypothetical protein